VAAAIASSALILGNVKDGARGWLLPAEFAADSAGASGQRTARDWVVDVLAFGGAVLLGLVVLGLTRQDEPIGQWMQALDLALNEPNLRRTYAQMIPGWGKADVGGSPYSIADYNVPADRGGEAGLRLFREKLNDEYFRWVNRISGAIIAGFGLLALVSSRQ